jgi:hypothetical protein
MPTRPVMRWINLGAVATIVERRTDVDRTRHVVRELRRRLTVDLPRTARVLEAAHGKRSYAMVTGSPSASAMARRSARGSRAPWAHGGRAPPRPWSTAAAVPRHEALGVPFAVMATRLRSPGR